MTIYLRAFNREAMDAALTAAGIPTEGCEWCAVDHIGPITRIEGDESVMVDSRHHTNLLFHRFTPDEAMLAALPTIPEPSNPARAWA